MKGHYIKGDGRTIRYGINPCGAKKITGPTITFKYVAQLAFVGVVTGLIVGAIIIVASLR